MVDYRNHRRFTLQYIKVEITPVSCRLKNPLKSKKGYHIIHRVETQLLYERVRNINKILYMYENKRAECYAKLKNLIHDKDISECSLLINKIKENMHSKIREKQIDEFDRCFKKYSGYHNNFSYGTFGRHVFQCTPPQYQCTGKQRTSSATTTSTAPTAPTTTTKTFTTSVPAPTAPFTNNKWVINLSTTHLSPAQEAPLTRGPNFTIVPKYSPGKLTLQW